MSPDPVRPAPPPLAFAALNLRRNPFGCVDPDEEAGLAVVDVGPAAAFLGDSASPGRRAVQILGPPGAGKSTHLRALARRRPGDPVWAWSAEDGWPPSPPPDGPLFVDDAQVLSRGDLARALRRRRRVALATQGCRARGLRRLGFETLTLAVPAMVDPGHLEAVVGRRLDAARRGAGPVPRPDRAHLESLLHRHGPDLRAILADLYRWVQQSAEAA